MISSKPRLVVPYGLKTLLEGLSRAVLKTNPPNITQFAAVYFKELIVFREGNTSLDIKDLVKQFHLIEVERWSEGTTREKKPECVKEPVGTSIVSHERTRMEKSTDTEEDNIAGPLFISKTTQFPSVHAELLPEPEETSEGARGSSSKPTTSKAMSPPSSPSPAAGSPEFAYVPADPAQFAAQTLEGLTEPEIEPEWEAAPEQGLMEPAIAASEAGQPPPYSNMWTLYCLTDMNQQSRPSPPPAPVPFPQATLYLSNPKDPQFLQQPPKVTSPTYVMLDDSKKTSAPPFILVGSNVQEAQDWKPLPGHAVVSQSDALKRYTAVQVPIAVPADQKFQKHTPNPQNGSPPPSGQDVPRPQSPVFLSVAFPVEDVAKKGSGSGDKRTPCGSYGIAGEITVTTAHVRRAETGNWQVRILHRI
ncbi:calcium-binding tyrosine phosphorylation-regulated protein isoform X1 [Prionailurus bengalensis]|uniref:calcium-binding tyrosine phosphorylation-regulated protein isoform X1 n=3 Tax=Prionailurus bengalensis TaxID=37029 RepID=UPI001CA88433|nr:calcium-binding tyrosine phosphorylation-regulated protein isoform X1 [Prionailurus bengalensis]XP_043414409.1 calcium-binding tyrosine phosphorylation-regulated protein isoform X1 [Prionailurus bengalensis]XP_043414410.1 calcium-binding tyrosine phosphorylation-regulated protein isoform X1 [Prionailurus bengalensis]XP_043414411.1 calcium-binding tyrosine phosphorylation-regulated protein isoform X1 [Prionailurus bengalensis]XP_043414412.1 calcium-binding tyrosine phosphorylation-regulated p